MELALICVSGVLAFVKWRKQIPVGIAGARVVFQFDDPRWENLTKTVVFEGVETKDVILDGDSCELPQQVVSKIGVSVRVGVYGTDSDKNIAIPTLWAHIGVVQDATDPSGDPAADPSLPIWAQLQQEVENIKVAGGVNVSGAVPGQLIVVKKVNENGVPTEWEPVDRTHYTTEERGTPFIDQSFDFDNAVGYDAAYVRDFAGLIPGKQYAVIWNGKEYVCEAVTGELSDSVTSINLSSDVFVIMGFFTDDPTEIGVYNVLIQPRDGSLTATVTVQEIVEKVVKLPGKFLPDGVPYVEDGGMTELIPETTFTPDSDGMLVIPTEVPNLVAGDTYTVNWNGVEYNCVAREFTQGGLTANVIGNIGLLIGCTNTGEPFVILRLPDDGVAETGVYAMIYVLDGSASVTLSIYGNGEVVHKIDPRCLPVQEDYYFKLDITDSGNFFDDVGNADLAIKNGAKAYARYYGIPYEVVFVSPEFIDGMHSMALLRGSAMLFCNKVGTTTPWYISHAILTDQNTGKLPASLMPEVLRSVTLLSTTPDSIKKFRLTVDDSGTITTTEIT